MLEGEGVVVVLVVLDPDEEPDPEPEPDPEEWLELELEPPLWPALELEGVVDVGREPEGDDLSGEVLGCDVVLVFVEPVGR